MTRRGDPEKTDRNAALLADHAAGMSFTDLSRKYGLGRSRVQRIVERYGAPNVTSVTPAEPPPEPPPAGRTVVWRPQPGPQTELLRCPVFEVLYGGARGGGKTDAMLGEWAQHAQLHGRWAIGRFFRRERVQLVEAYERAKALFIPVGAQWREVDKTFVMPNGARLTFSYLDNDADAEGYQGHAYTRVYIEELGNFPSEKPIAKLRATLRSAHGVPCRMRATANPGGPGHQWVYRRYVGPCPEGFRRIVEDGLDRAFIPAKVHDNPALLGADPGYIDRLKQSGSAALVRAWLDGDWDAVEGAFFDNWNPARHVIRPFKVPSWWVRFTSFDWGSARPFCVHWFAVSDGEVKGIRKGALVLYREWYGASAPNTGLKLNSEKVAEGILAREDQGERIRYRVADPSTFKQDDGPSIAEKMSLSGVHMEPADNTRIAGWEQIRLRLDGEEGDPMLLVFSTCGDVIRTLPAMQHDERKPEDIDTDGEDHAVDSLRYGAMSRPYWRAQPVKKRTVKDAYRWNDAKRDQPTGWAQ